LYCQYIYRLTYVLSGFPVDVEISDEERSVGVDSKLIGLRKLTNQRTRVGQEQLLQTFGFSRQISEDREAFFILGY
jgi:hypothetical protein